MTIRSMLCAFAMLALVATEAHAAVPTSTTVEGALTSAGGGAAADGTYDVTFSIYAAKGATKAAWSEGPVKVAVKGGRFSYALGTSKALSSTALAGLAQAWLGVKIGADPELPQQRMHAAPYALVADRAMQLACTGCVTAGQVANGGISAAKVGFNYAGSTTKGGAAKDLACTGCVSVKELKFDANVDLGGFSLKAKNGTFTGSLTAGTVTATSFAGDGSKLTGIKTPSGECKTAGFVVKGINADGSLKCVKAMDPAALPKDGLNEISNDLISNQFVDTIETSQKSVPIPDNQGSEAVSNLTFPNIGIAQKFDMYVHVENTDLSKVAISLLPPNDKKTGWVLCDPCGAKDAKIYKKTFNNAAKPKSGDIGYWIGKNPQGLWNLKVKDTSFCIVQAPGNAKYCNTTKKQDGWIATWNIKIQTLSNQKIAVAGDQFNSGNLSVSKDVSAKNLKLGTPGTCNAANLGKLSWDPKYGLKACHKNHPKSGSMTYKWVAAKASPAAWSGGCKSHNQQGSWRRYCLNGTDYDYKQDYFTVDTGGRINFKTAGFYEIKFYAMQHGCGHQHLRLLHNGSQKAYGYWLNDSKSDQWTQHKIAYLAPVKSGDYLEPWAYHDGCGNQYNWHSWNTAGSHSRFRIRYIGPLPE